MVLNGLFPDLTRKRRHGQQTMPCRPGNESPIPISTVVMWLCEASAV